MAWIKLRQDTLMHKKGDEVKVDDRYAKTLIEYGFAEYCDKDIDSPPKDKMVKKPKVRK